MVKLNLDIDDVEMTFEIPSEWDDVTVEQFQQLKSINESQYNLLELNVLYLSILAKIDKDFVYMMDSESFKKITDVLSFLNTEIQTEPAENIVVDGVEYWLKKDFNQLTMGESVSFEAILEQNDGDLERCIDKLLCIFLRKRKENGKLEAFKNDFLERSEVFKTIKITDVYNLFVFFLNGKI